VRRGGNGFGREDEKWRKIENGEENVEGEMECVERE
jgi:hypothetical protein